MKARIQWLTKEEGGREYPPQGTTYIAPARFEREYDKWPHEAWSLVLQLSEGTDKPPELVDVRFLAPSAPSSLLASGSRFELFEGRAVVARGEIL